MKKIALKYKIIGGLIIALVLLFAIKPSIAKNIYKKIINDFNKVDADLVKELDSLKKQREKDSIYYADAIKLKEAYYEQELIKANDKYRWLNQKYRQNEKELATYRSADFDGKFKLFTIAVIGKDTIQWR